MLILYKNIHEHFSIQTMLTLIVSDSVYKKNRGTSRSAELNR